MILFSNNHDMRQAAKLQLSLLVVAMLFAGCGKKSADRATAQESAKATVAGGNPAAVPGEGASGRNSILQLPFDNAAKLVMMNIGRQYQMTAIANGKPPKNVGELEMPPNQLKTKRDMQDREVEVVYGVDVKKFGDDAANFALAWEKTPDNGGWRMVLMADYVTVKYVSNAEFEAMKKAR